MNLYEFITHEEIETVSENIRNKADFEIERECKGYQFSLHSSRAGVDFKDVNKLKKYIDKQLGESRIDGYETIDEGQISLFEMME